MDWGSNLKLPFFYQIRFWNNVFKCRLYYTISICLCRYVKYPCMFGIFLWLCTADQHMGYGRRLNDPINLSFSLVNMLLERLKFLTMCTAAICNAQFFIATFCTKLIVYFCGWFSWTPVTEVAYWHRRPTSHCPSRWWSLHCPGHGGAHQDPLHFALPHLRLLLGGHGIYWWLIPFVTSPLRCLVQQLEADLRLIGYF